uniref:Acp54A1 n=1 Tax=Steinernema glaseri TaxID=37863 RepID=A0A1I8AFX3_9BILA
RIKAANRYLLAVMRLSVICVALVLLCHVMADPEEVPAELDRNGATEDPHDAEEPKKDASHGEVALVQGHG